MAYCQWLSAKTGSPVRLPTEAEWERAVRCGRDQMLYSWGDENPDIFEIYRTGWQDERPQIVGLFIPNAFGIHNLGDSVHEWCLDWYDPKFYERSSGCNPLNLEPSTRRVSRGGAWRHRVKVSRCAARSSLIPFPIYRLWISNSNNLPHSLRNSLSVHHLTQGVDRTGPLQSHNHLDGDRLF